MNRFAELQAEAQKFSADDNNKGDFTAIPMDSEEGFMKDFFNTINDVRTAMDNIEVKIKMISEKHGQALAAISEKQGQSSKEELDKYMQEVQAEANKVRRKLKAIDQGNKEQVKNGIPETHPDMRIRKAQHATLSHRFVEIMSKYNDIQANYKQKYQDRVKRQFKIVKPDATEEEIAKVVEGEDANVFAQQILQPSHAEAKQALDDILERHEEIVKLEKSLKELHELFTDMAMIVESQGEMIDRIEHAVAQSVDYVEEAQTQLTAARKHQSSARKKQIIIGLVVLVIIAIIILIILLQRRW
eukprot:Colp12_sorted_trinity150504_noHs@34039